jgi:hypothetical protein
MADPWEESYAPPAEPWNASYVQPKQNTGTLSDIGTSLKRGVEEIPGMVTGLADIPTALAFGARPFTKAAEAAGEATGFQPGKWAETAQAEYSPQAKQSAEEIGQVWQNPESTWGQKLAVYATHPGYVAQQVAESLPSMVVGGIGGRAALTAGRLAEGGASALERAVGEKMAAPVAAGAGEGAVQAGQQMDQYQGEDQRKNAIAAIGSGLVDAVIGVGAGRLAEKMGLETAETAMVKGFNGKVEKELSLGKRVAGGAISESVLQELPQSAQEQVWQNYADNKPLWEGVPRNAIEGALAGFIMGGVANIPGGKKTAPAPNAAPAADGENITMAPPGSPLTPPPNAPEGFIPYERVAPSHVTLAPEGAPLTEPTAAGRAPQAPSNWELAPPGAAMSAPYKALALPHYKYDTNIVFADGSTGTQHQVDQHLASLPEAQRVPELARMLQGAYVAPPAPAVPHPGAEPGTMKAAVNVAVAHGALPTTHEGLNTVQRNGTISNEKSKQNELQAGASQDARGGNAQIENDARKVFERRIASSNAWLDAIGRGETEASANEKAERAGVANETSIGKQNILENTNVNRSQIRAQGDNGGIAREGLAENGTRTSQGSQRAKQRSEQSGIGEQFGTQANTQFRNDAGATIKSGEIVGVKARAMVEKIRTLRNMPQNEESARIARSLQSMLAETVPGSQEEHEIIKAIEGVRNASEISSTTSLGEQPGGARRVGRQSGGGMGQGEQGLETAQARQGQTAAEVGGKPTSENVTPVASAPTAGAALRPHVATLVARKSLIDQTVPGLIDKAKQALATGKGKASDFTKAATLFPTKEAPIREALKAIAEGLKQPTVSGAIAKAKQLSVGKTALTAEPITVKNGVVHMGEYPAMDYETGADITVPANATPQQIKAALEKGGAISPGHKVFGAGPAPEAKFSIASNATPAEYHFMRNTMEELVASNPEVMRHDKSTAKTLDGAIKDIMPGAKEVTEARLEYPKAGYSVVRRAFTVPDQKFKFYTFETSDGKIYLDISNSEPGRGGGAAYAALSDYAYNTGKKFIGDPSGLSADATIRRTAQMLFSAIRHGTTEHLGASVEQMEGNRDIGARPLKWGKNNIENFNALAETFVDTIEQHIPEIKEVRYDFNTGKFYNTTTGKPVGEADFKRAATNARARGYTTAGEGSLRTASLIQSLLQEARGSTEQRGRVVFGILNGKMVSGLTDMFARTAAQELPIKPHSLETARHDMLAALAGKERIAMQSLLDSGRARIITSDQANKLLGGDIISDYPDGLARAFYSPESNTTYFIADHLDRTMSSAELKGLIRHEVAVHAYQLGKSSAEFKDILRQLDMMRRAGNAQVQEAYKRVPNGTPAEQVHEEALAYLVQHAPEMGLIQRVIAWMRNALRALGWTAPLRTDDILHMAQYAMERSVPVERNEGFKPMFSRTSYGELNDAQSAAITRVVGKPQTVLERAKAFRTGWRKSLEQGVFDQYAPIKDVSQAGYIKARMSKGGDSTLEAIFMYGKPMLDQNGDIKVQFDKANGGLNGFANVLAKLDGEHDRFLLWVAALRAESLKAIGLENLWSHEDIDSLKSLNQGELQNGESREKSYTTALREMMAYNNSVLDIAAKRGLISEDTRKMYEATPYVPFYRLADEGAVQGFTAQSGMVNQYAWKKLQGGTNKLNEDLLANMLQNWSHLITASARNDAARVTLEDAARLGAADEVPAGTPVKGTVMFRENNAEGKNVERHFIVNDPHLTDAITSLGAVVRVPKAMRMFKHYLTLGVTVNPAFKIRNLLRDSVQSMALSDLSMNPATNIAEGYKLTHENSEVRAQMLAGGAIIRFGSMLDGQTADMGRELVEKMGVPKDHILDDANKVEKFWKHTVKPAFDAYQELGDRGEQINRAALYKQLTDKGMSHGEAAYWARDLMDFSMSGSWTAIRFITQTVPFMNARLQGLYKLGRSAQADKKRFAMVVGGVTMASLALLAAYHDDDDWKKREDWDRDNYWWFKIGGKAFYVPKPFEIGAIATLAERTAELMGDDEMTGKRFSNELFNLVNSQLSMNPTPQLIKPLIDLWANKDGFTGKPIETMGMERLRPEDRYKQSTSGVARVLSQLGLPNPTALAMGNYQQMSPVQIDYLLRGYFSWVGSSATTALDYGIFHPIMGKTERPAMQLQDVFLAGNFVKDLPNGSSRYVTQMYNQAKEIEQAYASYRAALQAGDKERAASLMETEGPQIRQYHMVEAVKRMESQWSARSRMIERSNLSADAKRDALNKIEAERDALARRVKP